MSPDAATAAERRKLEIIEGARAKRPRFTDERITMAHGAGGKASRRLVEGMIVPALGGAELGRLGDAGRLAAGGAELAITTDSYVVRPLRFPGGSIGELAVNGTVNDLAVSGARPLAISLALILEEGLEEGVLRAELDAVAAAAERAGVEVLTGDTKVVERGAADGMYITTAGVGQRDDRADLDPAAIRPGDRFLLSGTLGDHGTAIMLARGEFELDADVRSDTRSLWPAAEALIGAAGGGLRCLRDATRGGAASALNELARASRVGIEIQEARLPVRPAVSGAAELLGIDPLHVANEGKLIAVVGPDAADAALDALRAVPGSEDAAEIGIAAAEPPAMVVVETAFGGRRVAEELVGDPLPRIC